MVRITSLLLCIYHNRHVVVMKKIMKNFVLLHLYIVYSLSSDQEGLEEGVYDDQGNLR